MPQLHRVIPAQAGIQSIDAMHAIGRDSRRPAPQVPLKAVPASTGEQSFGKGLRPLFPLKLRLYPHIYLVTSDIGSAQEFRIVGRFRGPSSMDANVIASTTAAVLSALAAVFSVVFSMKAKNNADVASRPYLSLENLRMEPKRLPSQAGSGQLGPAISNIAVAKSVMINRGQRPAVDLAARVIIIAPDLSGVHGKIESTLADDFPHGAEWLLQLGEEILQTTQHPSFIIVVGVRYFDPQTKTTYRQIFVNRWDGVINGEVMADIVAATRHERDQILSKFGADLKDFI